MDGANADSDHSMTWEDFFGSTTDLTPTLIGIYDSLLQPPKSRSESRSLESAKDARNDPPVNERTHGTMTEETKDNVESKSPRDPSKIAGSVKLPIAAINKSSLYTMRTISEKNGASDKCDSVKRTVNETKVSSEFDNLSPNVKRMLSSASETTTLKFQKKTQNVVRSSARYKTNIPLVGATSKISQSGLEILPSMEVYDQPVKTFARSKSEDQEPKCLPPKLEFKLGEQVTYDVPTNNKPAIYDVPSTKKNAFESLSLPYIDQSIELSISSNDREFDIKLSSKDNSPQKSDASRDQSDACPQASPAKSTKDLNTNSLHRKDFHKSESPKLKKSEQFPGVTSSTGNLKNLPEKESRLNPPSVEVSRPLSMSSIASSSSTSSSGVQNKGVNSAYLASIESLDDHSDADMTSANGSNNFVNSAGVLKNTASEERNSEKLPDQQCAEEMSGLSQLERVCSEIVQTENVYVEDLRQVVEGYLHVWRQENTFSEDELTELFNNVEDIYTFNRSLCSELNSCRLDATCIARCFVNNTTGFSVYTSYCTGYPRTMERLAALASTPHSARAFRERQMALGHPLPLASYLLKPVQRILKYHLLLQNVVKQCASRDTEYALLKMTGIAQHIDDMKRRHEHAVRVQEIQSLLYGWNGPDLTTYGELCAEGTFRVFGAKAMRHAFLFDKMLLITKNREDGILAYKSHIMCNNMMLVESIAGAALSFHVIPWDAPRAQLTLQARSPRHKREWTLLLKRVILENYNAVIPSHARQLVMELGQNKTDDDMLAEKSHSLITQASMRKQLSAPEYLEKRKLERERRKSFENGTRGRTKKTNRKYTLTNTRVDAQECDCAQVSAEKGTDYTCDTCYTDICWECEAELSKDKSKENKCGCKNEMTGEKCAECDKTLQYIDAGSAEHLERKSSCKCSDFKSSQESFGKEFNCTLNKTRGYHSSDNIVGYTDTKCKDDSSDTNNSMTNVRNLPKTCLKCAKIKENIVVTDSTDVLRSRKSRCNDHEKHRLDVLRSKSKDDPQRSKLSKIGTWRRKSEPGLQQNTAALVAKKSLDNYTEKNETRGNEKIEFECRNCGSNKISRKLKNAEAVITSDPEMDTKKGPGGKNSVEIKMYNTKNIPKKISKLKKNRAKGMRFGTDTTAKFYADLSTDVSTENILHISESNDSLNTEKRKESDVLLTVPSNISKDEDMDEETYKKLIEKTDSFKKNELERVKYLNKQKVINEGSEAEEKPTEAETKNEEIPVSSEETEEPLEHIISQLLLENREFQKLLKKQQQRNSAHRRHQRLLKTHSNPEQAVATNKSKPNYTRQSSQTLDYNKVGEKTEDSEEDHIYETLRVDKRKSNAFNDESDCKKSPTQPQNVLENTRPIFESDYVYLSFDKLNKLRDGIYDVPNKPPEKVNKTHGSDYYVAMEKQGPPTDGNNENVYDNIVEVCRRKKETSNNLPGEYLPMSPDQQSPNTPEIWLSRQKEHFNVCRDRKSGSLPRSFQVVTSNNQEDNNLSTFKCKPNSNSKTYLNRDGKVMSSDRPFTIASDKGEISYDDVESYMSEGDILKFNKSKTENDYGQNISQSTLELEEEIDRCYKNNFEKISLDANKNESSLNISQPNLNTSMTSSCEVLPIESEDKSKDNEVIHPEHKIYKPTSNVLSLKNVLSRFKNRSSNKSCDESEINANEQSSPDSGKSDLKSPTGDKRSALNPRNYSKNLLQRFRSIIGDEHSDDNQNKTSKIDDTPINVVKSNIKLVITTTDKSPTTSTIAYTTNNDNLSRSVCEQTTLSESQNEKNNLEILSHSCDNIIQRKQENLRPTYEKSLSLTTSNTSSPSKSNNSSYQSLNKLPIYMQGSKHLGARIAQSDYLDPTTLMSDKSPLKNINILINKNAVRPDSLFSNSSFVTSSSEGTYLENQNKINHTTDDKEVDSVNLKVSKLEENTNGDESYYERSFEKIEEVTDKDVFRDSAVYSDQEEAEESNINKSNINKSKNITRVQSVKRNVSVRTQKITVTSNVNEKSSTQSRVVITSRNQITEDRSQNKPKIAPPVPAKPRMSNIPSSASFQTRHSSKSAIKTQEQPVSLDCSSTKSIKQSVTKSESTSQVEVNKSTKKDENPTCGIQLKRMSFERASLDSATRKFKTTTEKRLSIDPPKSKSVLERRMEIEQMSRNLTKTQISKKPIVQATKPKLVTTKVANFERSLSNVSKDTAEVKSEGDRESKKECAKEIAVPSSSVERDANIPTNKQTQQKTNSISEKSESEDLKASWVKQVVNKFQ